MESVSAQEIDPAHPGTELTAFIAGIVVQVNAGAINMFLTAAVLRGSDAVNIFPILAHDEHPGAIGNISGVHGDGSYPGLGAGGRTSALRACSALQVSEVLSEQQSLVTQQKAHLRRILRSHLLT